MSVRTRTGLIALAAALLGPQLQASVITVPAGLPPGTPHRLVFVTADTIAATSTNIATYNTFVTNEANSDPTLLALGLTWTAIASTPSTDAITNIGTPTGAVYNLAGVEVATSTSSIFGTFLMAKINVDQNGNIVATDSPVWTGTAFATSDGANGHQVGTAHPERGQVNTGAGWVEDAQAPP